MAHTDKPIASFKGDEFRSLLFQYSRQRMTRDTKYKRDVIIKLEQKRKERLAKQKAAAATQSVEVTSSGTAA